MPERLKQCSIQYSRGIQSIGSQSDKSQKLIHGKKSDEALHQSYSAVVWTSMDTYLHKLNVKVSTCKRHSIESFSRWLGKTEREVIFTPDYCHDSDSTDRER